MILEDCVKYNPREFYNKKSVPTEFRHRIKILNIPDVIYRFLEPFYRNNLAFSFYNATTNHILLIPNKRWSVNNIILYHEIFDHMKYTAEHKLLGRLIFPHWMINYKTHKNNRKKKPHILLDALINLVSTLKYDKKNT